MKELTAEQEENSANFHDKGTGAELEVQEKMALLEWIANNYKKFGCTLEFVTNRYTQLDFGLVLFHPGWAI